MAVYTGALTGSLTFSSASTTYEVRPTSTNVEIVGGLHVSGASGLTVNGRDIVQSIDNLQSGSHAEVGSLNLFTGSIAAYTASISTHTGSVNTELGVLRTATGSLSGRIDAINTGTSSFFTNVAAHGVISSSQQLKDLGFKSGSNIISSSTQLTALGFVSESAAGSISSSAQISGLGFITASTYSELVSIPSGIVSSSNQVQSFGFVTSSTPAGTISSSAQITSFGFISESNSTAALNTFSASIQAEVDSIQVASSSYALKTGISGSFKVSSASLAANIATNTTNVGTLTAATSSYALKNAISGSINSVTSSFALKTQISGSFNVASASLANRIIANTEDIATINAATSSFAVATNVVPNSLSSSFALKTGISGSFTVASSSLAASITSAEADIVTNAGGITRLTAATGSYASSTTAALKSEVSGAFAVTSASLATRINNVGSGETGSLLNTGSVNLNTLTFTKGNGDTFDLTIDTGSGGVSAYSSLTGVPSNIVSSSNQLASSISGSFAVTSASLASRIAGNDTDIATNLTEINVLSAATSSYALASGVVANASTSSFALTSNVVANSSTSSFALSSTAALKSEVSGAFAVASASLASNIATNTTEINVLSAATSSYLSSVPSGTVSGSAQISSSAAASGFSNITYDGNKVISQTHLPGFFTSSFNPGTSGSVTEFLDAIFFPNTAPTITTTNQTVAEFTAASSTITTVAGTDPEGQSLTFGTSSAYTANFVAVASNGVMTLTTIATASMNTEDRGDGENAHPIILRATDTFGASVNKTIYLTVTPNAAPVWRLTGPTGNIITNGFSSSRNENASAGEVAKLYFTDAESDTITITSSSDATGHFSLVKYSNYVALNQVTASLDYENKTSYTFGVTASDEHAVAGQDVDAKKILPITVTVVDNATPSISNQNLGSINEDSDAGTSVGSITATDPESDTITFSNFTLKSLALDGSNVSLGTYSGTSQKTDPTENAFQMNSSGVVTRKAGVVLNSDLINSYVYRASVSDAFNGVTASADISMSIADDQALTIGGNNAFYIIESALSGSNIYDDTSGYTGTTAQFTSNQSPVTWSVQPTSNFAVDSNGYLRIARNISGSSDVGGDALSGEITGSNDFGTETRASFTVNITDNVAPTITFSDTTANQNTNGARPSNTLVTLTFSDTEGDTIDFNSFTSSFAGAALSATKVGSTYEIRPTANLSAGTYQITASIADTASFATRTSTDTFTITQSPIGTLTTNGTFRIIETAVSESNIVTNINGRTGTQGDLGVTYSPQHNSAAVTSFTSSNAAILVNSSGNLTLGVHLSGSTTGSGATISSTITYQDQFNNIGSGSISVAVRPNLGPTASFSDVSANLTASIDIGTNLSTVTITDEESNTPFSMSLSGAGASKLQAVPQNANSSSYQIQASTAITAAETITYNAVVSDIFEKTITYSSRTLEVAAARGLVYFYSWDGGSAASEATAIASLGDSGADNVDIEAGSVIAKFASGSIGSSSFSPSYVGGTVSRVASKSLADMSDSNAAGLSTLGYANFSGGSKRLLVLFPSASNLDSKPVSMYDGVPPDSTGTAGEFYLYAKDAAIAGTIGTGIYYFPLHGSFQSEGYNRWGMIFAEGENTNNSRYFLMPDSASAP